MGTWLHSKSEMQKWKEFIEVKISKISQSGNWWGLMLFSFIVVFREAFEVVLFLSALKLDIPSASGSPIGLAVLSSIIIIVAFAVLMLQYSKRLPIKQIFRISAITMIVLAVVLVGKGFSALQEAGVVGMNLLSDWIRFEPLGIYPTIQSLGAQLVTLALTIGMWIYMERPKQKVAEIEIVSTDKDMR
jgi:high-affinity iron transporter